MKNKIIVTEETKALAQKAKAAKIQYAKDNLVLDYGDEQHWRELAKKHNIRLPIYYHPNRETKYLKRAMKKLNVDMKEYLESCGVLTLKELVSLNPTHTALSEVGFLLEYVEEKSLDNQTYN